MVLISAVTAEFELQSDLSPTQYARTHTEAVSVSVCVMFRLQIGCK